MRTADQGVKSANNESLTSELSSSLSGCASFYFTIKHALKNEVNGRGFISGFGKITNTGKLPLGISFSSNADFRRYKIHNCRIHSGRAARSDDKPDQ